MFLSFKTNLNSLLFSENITSTRANKKYLNLIQRIDLSRISTEEKRILIFHRNIFVLIHKTNEYVKINISLAFCLMVS